MSRMISATRTPIASELGGSWPAKASTWPLAPTVMPSSSLAALTASMTPFAVSVETSSPASPPSKVMVALAT